MEEEDEQLYYGFLDRWKEGKGLDVLFGCEACNRLVRPDQHLDCSGEGDPYHEGCTGGWCAFCQPDLVRRREILVHPEAEFEHYMCRFCYFRENADESDEEEEEEHLLGEGRYVYAEDEEDSGDGYD